MTPRGFVVYEGPSRLGRYSDVVGIVTTSSVNSKTGNMYQLWVLDQSVVPTTAAKTGLDEGNCGNCAMRPVFTAGTKDPTCYVTLIHGTNQIWKSWQAGKYEKLRYNTFFERPLRMAAYGDPAALPREVLNVLVACSKAGYTAYTHQWKRFQGPRHICMASVNNVAEQSLAVTRGWRTFRVVAKHAHPSPIATAYVAANGRRHEITCPASTEAGNRTTCLKCLLCNGMRPDDRRANICIQEH